MKRTVWDRLDGAAMMEGSTWEGEDAPTNVAPPDFARKEAPSAGNGEFLKGVLVGVGASACAAGALGIAGLVAAIALLGLPSLPSSTVLARAPGAGEIAATSDEPAGALQRSAPVAATPARALARPAPAERSAAPAASGAAVAKSAATATPTHAPAPALARVEARPGRKAPALTAPPAAKVAEPDRPTSVAKPIAVPEPDVTEVDLSEAAFAPVPAVAEAKRPSREELLKIALTAKQHAAAVPAPAPAAKVVTAPKIAAAPTGEAPEEEPPAVEEKWFPEDDTETTASEEGSSGDLADVLGP